VVSVLVVPVVVLAGWWIRGANAGQAVVGAWAEAGRSISLSLTSALIIVVLAIPLAMLTERYNSRLGRFVENAAWITSGLPHLTVGLALLLVGVTLLLPLYQSVLLLLLAYVMMFLPQALSPVQAAIGGVSPRLEEASRSLGKSALSTFRAVTLPLTSPGVLAGAGLVFLTTMKELPATLLLRPTGFETLALRVWSTAGEGFYTRASTTSLILIAVSALPLFFLLGNDN
jgi:iron(III) transport system permease protein